MKPRRDLIYAETLALERDYAALWARFPHHQPNRSRSDLHVLQQALDSNELQLDTERDRRAIGIALGMVAVHELGLKWIRLGDEWGVEWALSEGDSATVAHPLPMVENRADDGSTIALDALFEGIASLFSAPSEPRGWTAEFDSPAPVLERQLGALAMDLRASADLSYVMIRGKSFTLVVDLGRGNANDLTMQVSFAGDRAMLVVGGGRGPAYDSPTLHQHARTQIEQLIERHVARHPEAADAYGPLTDAALDEPG